VPGQQRNQHTVRTFHSMGKKHPHRLLLLLYSFGHNWN
jgi:hypothetical protein